MRPAALSQVHCVNCASNDSLHKLSQAVATTNDSLHKLSQAVAATNQNVAAIAKDLATPPGVHCANCASSDSLGTVSLAVAVIGVIVAAIALIVSMRVLKIMRVEHEEFVKQLTARAQFRIIARTLLNQATIQTHAGLPQVANRRVRVEIGLTNIGEKVARLTTVNVLVPRTIDNIRWTDSTGAPHGDPAAEIAETLPDRNGNAVPAARLTHTVEGLGRANIVRWVEFTAGTWCGPEILIRIEAESDDLSKDDPESFHDHWIELDWAPLVESDSS